MTDDKEACARADALIQAILDLPEMEYWTIMSHRELGIRQGYNDALTDVKAMIRKANVS